VFGNHRKLLSLLVAIFGIALTFTAGPAFAAPAHSVQSTAAARSVLPARLRAFYWARTQYGKAYEYGGTGPRGYDCSGLVMEAYKHAGINLPRTTGGMHGDWTFGAHAPGQIVGWIQWGPWWYPTAFYRIR